MLPHPPFPHTHARAVPSIVVQGNWLLKEPKDVHASHSPSHGPDSRSPSASGGGAGGFHGGAGGETSPARLRMFGGEPANQSAGLKTCCIVFYVTLYCEFFREPELDTCVMLLFLMVYTCIVLALTRMIHLICN